MKSILLSAVALSFAVSVLAEEKPPQLKDLKDKASYAIGLNVGFNFKRQNVDVNQDAFTAGFKDALSGRRPLKRTRRRRKNFSPQTKQRKASKRPRTVCNTKC